jgi:hypothetical protein
MQPIEKTLIEPRGSMRVTAALQAAAMALFFRDEPKDRANYARTDSA